MERREDRSMGPIKWRPYVKKGRDVKETIVRAVHYQVYVLSPSSLVALCFRVWEEKRREEKEEKRGEEKRRGKEKMGGGKRREEKGRTERTEENRREHNLIHKNKLDVIYMSIYRDEQGEINGSHYA